MAILLKKVTFKAKKIKKNRSVIEWDYQTGLHFFFEIKVLLTRFIKLGAKKLNYLSRQLRWKICMNSIREKKSRGHEFFGLKNN